MVIKRMIITDSTYYHPPGFALGTSVHISVIFPLTLEMRHLRLREVNQQA